MCHGKLLLSVILFVVMTSASYASDTFYYYFNEKIPMEKHPDKAIIGLKNSNFDIFDIFHSKDIEINNYVLTEKDNIKDGKANIWTVRAKNEDIAKLISRLSEEKEIEYISSVYTKTNEMEVGTTGTINVQFKKNTTEQQKMKLYNRFSAKVIMSDWFDQITVPEKSC